MNLAIPDPTTKEGRDYVVRHGCVTRSVLDEVLSRVVERCDEVGIWRADLSRIIVYLSTSGITEASEIVERIEIECKLLSLGM